MFRVSVLIAAVAFATSAIASTPAARQAPISAEAVQRWMFDYRHKPDPMRVPVAVKAMARLGAFKDAESSGVYVGFLAGVIGGNPAWAEDLIARMFPLPPESHWAVIRAIAYSGLPEWKRLLRNFAWRMPERRAMIDKYISGELPTLERIAFEADLFDTHEPPRSAQLPAMRSLDTQVRRMKLDVATLAPVHGKPVPWSTFVSALGAVAK